MTEKTRQLHIDALKMMASQFIVLHHLAAYGPVSDTLSQTAPAMMDWLYEYGRLAVQVFLVLGGYLAASSLAPGSTIWSRSPFTVMVRRYRRLVLPCLAALLLAVACAALAHQWLDDDFVPGRPTWAQVMAHVLLLQGLLNQESLSAGVWYVAIDFQLFVLMTLLLWLSHRNHRTAGHAPPFGPGLAQTLVLGLMLASLFYFNRNPDWDNWAIYFFGAYGMGAAAYWAGCSRRPGLALALLAITGLLALMLDFRERIALALVVAVLLGLLEWRRSAQRTVHPELPAPVQRLIAKLGQVSYSLFLVHFPVLMLGNALFAHLDLSTPMAAAMMMLACWLVSVLTALLFERWVEAPLSRLTYRKSGSTSAAASRPVQSSSPRTR
jgi:peptidoglycan/LPS O-acetylase OafA/YrhL